MGLALEPSRPSTETKPCDPISEQASRARLLGSEFIGAILDAASRSLGRAPQTRLLISSWPGDPASDAVALRLNAALHALARSGRHPALSALYDRRHGAFDGVIGDVMEAEDRHIAGWLLQIPQTNEVGRSTALAAALLEIQGETGADCELLEIGASSGLNLNVARYAHRLGPASIGDVDSAVRIAPDWQGALPALGGLRVASARGVDLQPPNLDDADTRERLIAYVWADQTNRLARLRDAIAIARRHKPDVSQGSAGQWLADALAGPELRGRCRVVYHSMVAQYLTVDERQRINLALADAAARATRQSPLAKVGFEWSADRSAVMLTMTLWPGGASRLLAVCHPYGDWVHWRPRPFEGSWRL